MTEKHFPNGFASWQETHYEVVSAMTFYLHNHPEIVIDGGVGRLYELAEEWTDTFERLHKDEDWDGEFLGTIDTYMSERLNDLKDETINY